MKRLWVDTNILLRFLTGDPQNLYERSARLMDRAERGEIILHVEDLVIAEAVWTLKSFYKKSMSQIAEVLTALVSTPGIDVENQEILIRALQLSSEKDVDFLDALLALRADAAGETVCTFDRTDFKRLPAEWISP